MKGNEIEVRMFGDEHLSAKTVGGVLSATDDLFRAVAAEMGVEGIGLSLVDFRYVCDGCQITRPEPHPDWFHDDAGNDYCPACIVREVPA